MLFIFQVKIELFQQVAAEAEKKRSEKTENKKPPKAKGHKSVAQALSEINNTKGIIAIEFTNGLLSMECY